VTRAPEPEREPVPAGAGEGASGQAPFPSPPAGPAREPPPPLEANDQLVDAVITVGWAIALVVLLVVRTDLPPAERWWIWVVVVGVAQGLFGLVYLPHLKRARQRAAQRRAARPGPAREQP
jgi:hypothetical protein